MLEREPERRVEQPAVQIGRGEREDGVSRLAIAYGTRDGHTAQVAHAAGKVAREAGWMVDVFNVREVSRDFSFEPYDAAIFAAPVLAGRYLGAVRAFVRAHHTQLAEIPTALISVSWSATKQLWAPPVKQREQADEQLIRETGWRPGQIISVGGAIRYTKHHWLARWIWSLFIRHAGGPHDLTRDYDFTDWEALRRETIEVLTSMQGPARTAS